MQGRAKPSDGVSGHVRGRRRLHGHVLPNVGRVLSGRDTLLSVGEWVSLNFYRDESTFMGCMDYPTCRGTRVATPSNVYTDPTLEPLR